MDRAIDAGTDVDNLTKLLCVMLLHENDELFREVGNEEKHAQRYPIVLERDGSAADMGTWTFLIIVGSLGNLQVEVILTGF